MGLIHILIILTLILVSQCIQFSPPAVSRVVSEILDAYDGYVHYNGSTSSDSESDFEFESPTFTVQEGLGVQARQVGAYWYEQIPHRGIAAWGTDGYRVYRNVKDFGAKGDGITDDTAAINAAISAQSRCGRGCSSSSTTLGVVYFPSGTYLLSSSIISFYNTVLLGNPNSLPVLRARADFQGFGIIDGDPYWTENLNWGSTNVFFRQVRNFVLDTRGIPGGNQATGIHWPTAQATSLQNVVFELSREAGNRHTGLFCESGSAGFMTDLTFNGGVVGASIGNQQFTMRNLVFNNCGTAISQLWDWGWLYQGISINNCGIGIDISAGGSNTQTVGSVIVLDSSITNTPIGILTAHTLTSLPDAAGSLILENVQLTNVPTAIKLNTGATILAGTGGSLNIPAWGQGHQYVPNGPTSFQGPISPNPRPAGLLGSSGKYYTQSKPQYANLPLSAFFSARAAGAVGNGITDDTIALQAVINTATAAGGIAYIDAGTYRVSGTIFVPRSARIVGEGFSVIMSYGSYFNDMSRPRPVIKIGNAGDTGRVELSDLIISTQGTQMGAVLIEYNLASPASTPSGLWDVHTRIGGFAGSGLQWAQCPKQPGTTGRDGSGRNNACIGAFMSMHVGKSGSGLYMENCWLWSGDHDIDDQGNRQITVYSGRGFLIESVVGNIWLVGTGSEHHTLYQYSLQSTQNLFMGFIQTESPYYQPNPSAPIPFVLNTDLQDPDFGASCAGATGNCRSAWGLRIVGSRNVNVYGAGLYSFFDNYSTTCSNNPGPENCQNNILSLEAGSSSANSNINIYTLSTVGTTNMITVGGRTVARYSDNINVYPDTVALFRSGGGGGMRVSDDGTCGVLQGVTCLGSRFGDCCSRWGWCGREADWCGDGCQRGAGGCW